MRRRQTDTGKGHRDGKTILERLQTEIIMSKTTTSYKEGLVKDLTDPEEAAAYLNAVLVEGSQEAFLLALRDIAEAKGMARISRKAHLNRESLYRMLSSKGNPQLASLASILETAGLRLAVEVKEPKVA
jgi:probable addiction module antidote protein